MVPLQHLSVIEFSGVDAGHFLQAQLSADVLALGPGESGFAGVCNPAGRVLGLLLLRRDRQSLRAICAATLAGELVARLQKYILRAAVNVAKRAEMSVYGLEAGEAAPAGASAFWTENGCYVVCVNDSVARSGDARRQQAWKAGELSRGVTWLEPASSGRFLPQMLGLESIGALSFSKGCYPGQEVISRTRHLGRLKRRPVLCTVQHPLSPEIMENVLLAGPQGEASAVIADHAGPGEGQTVLLLVARMEAGFPLQTLEWRGQRLQAQWG